MKTLTNFPYSKVLVLGLAKVVKQLHSYYMILALTLESTINFRWMKMKRQSDSLNWVVT